MKKIAILIYFFGLISCIKEKTTSFTATLRNTTSHQIIIKPYSFGNIVSNNIISLLPNTEFQLAKGFDRGINGNAGFSSMYFENADSLKVTFDNLYSITHYFKTPATYNNKYYSYSSLRNLGNYLSFNFNSIDISSYKRENTYTYTFVEQDYLDSK